MAKRLLTTPAPAAHGSLGVVLTRAPNEPRGPDASHLDGAFGKHRGAFFCGFSLRLVYAAGSFICSLFNPYDGGPKGAQLP